jgi:putative Mg2+ transporter-C (MgtC) family protein
MSTVFGVRRARRRFGTVPIMDIFWEELTRGLSNSHEFGRVMIRLLAATLLGAIVGFERERARKSAGLRTHILVCLGTAAFVLVSSSSGLSPEGLSRVIQGIVTGIGFIGAGQILKVTEQHHVRGLTTAASVWMTAAIGVSVGLGAIGIAALSTLLALIILAVVGAVERRAEKRERDL